MGMKHRFRFLRWWGVSCCSTPWCSRRSFRRVHPSRVKRRGHPWAKPGKCLVNPSCHSRRDLLEVCPRRFHLP